MASGRRHVSLLVLTNLTIPGLELLDLTLLLLGQFLASQPTRAPIARFS